MDKQDQSSVPSRRQFLVTAAAAFGTAHINVSAAALQQILAAPPLAPVFAPRVAVSYLVKAAQHDFLSGRLELPSATVHNLDFDSFFAGTLKHDYGDTLSERGAQKKRADHEDKAWINASLCAEADRDGGRWFLDLQRRVYNLAELQGSFDALCQHPNPEAAFLQGVEELCPGDRQTREKIMRQFDGWPEQGGAEKRVALQERFAQERAYFLELCDTKLAPRFAQELKDIFAKRYGQYAEYKQQHNGIEATSERSMLLRDLSYHAQHDGRMTVACTGPETTIKLTYQPRAFGYESGLQRIQHRLDVLYATGTVGDKPSIEIQNSGGKEPITHIVIRSSDPWMRQFARELLQDYATKQLEDKIQKFGRQGLTVKTGDVTDGQQQFTLHYDPRGARNIIAFPNAIKDLKFALELVARLQRPESEVNNGLAEVETSAIPENKVTEVAAVPAQLTDQSLTICLSSTSSLAHQLRELQAATVVQAR